MPLIPIYLMSFLSLPQRIIDNSVWIKIHCVTLRCLDNTGWVDFVLVFVCLTTFFPFLRHSMLCGCRPCEAHITRSCELAAQLLGVFSGTAECHSQTCGGRFPRLLSVTVACCCWAWWVWRGWVKAPQGRAETAECAELNAEFQDV